MNFDRNVTKAATDGIEQDPVNVDNFTKKYQILELAPYTVIQ